MSFIAFLIIRGSHLNWVLTVTVLWDAFAFSFLVTSWVVFFTRPVGEIVKQANKDDGSRLFVLISILVTSFASMFTVLLLVISKNNFADRQTLTVLLSITGMMLSWVMVHTIFTFHYAHLYYDLGKNDTPGRSGLEFPAEKKPDYIDFAYFAFTIGCTFQVSDVEISSPKIRRVVLLHGLLSFALNTFVIALTINLIAGFKIVL